MKTYIVIAALLLAGLPPTASRAEKPAIAFFNEGSASFIKGNREDALARVKEGLVPYPDDYRLLALKKAIEENQQQQQQQQQQDQQQEKEKQDKEKQEQEQKKQQQQEEKEKQEQERKEQQQDQGNDEGQPQDQQPQEQQAQPQEPQQMTREEAAQLLDALRRQEQAARERIRLSAGQPVPVEKDW